jgi:hypothetical protein
MTARLHLHHRLVKSDGFAEARTPSLDEYPLLRSSLRLPLALLPEKGSRSSRIRHRACDFAAAGRLRAPFR